MVIIMINDEIYDGFLYNVCINCECYNQCKELDFEKIDSCIDGRESNNKELFLEERYL